MVLATVSTGGKTGKWRNFSPIIRNCDRNEFVRVEIGVNRCGTRRYADLQYKSCTLRCHDVAQSPHNAWEITAGSSRRIAEERKM